MPHERWSSGPLRFEMSFWTPLNPTVSGMSLLSWLVGFRAAVDRENDPRHAACILKTIVVRKADFDRWLKKVNDSRGPRPGTTGYSEADRKMFRAIANLLHQGKARSAHGAAMILARSGRLAGAGTETSRAKRVANLFRTERGGR